MLQLRPAILRCERSLLRPRAGIRQLEMRSAALEDLEHFRNRKTRQLCERNDAVRMEEIVDLRTDAFDDREIVGVLEIEAGRTRCADIDDGFCRANSAAVFSR